MTTFGIELEFTGITRKKAAEVIKAYLHSDQDVKTYGPASRVVTDKQGREWKLEYDGSINESYDKQCELVTPVLTTADLPTLKGIVGELKRLVQSAPMNWELESTVTFQGLATLHKH